MLKPDGLVCVAREPLAPEGGSLQGSAPVVYATGALKRLFADRGFSLVSEDASDDRGTLWFKGEADS